MKSDLLRIIETYGISSQLKHLYGELYELTEAIIEYEQNMFASNEAKLHIAEEVADMYVMINQIIVYYGLPTKMIKAIMKDKIKRQNERIDNSEK